MASYRKPRGTYVRSTGDWFYQDMATAGAMINTPNTFPPYHYPIYCLFNNDQQGRYLHVLGMAITDDGLGRAYWDIGSGSTGTLAQSGNPVKFDQGQQSGQVFTSTATNASQTAQVLPNIRGGLADYFGTGPYFPNFPMWVIPVGMSLLISNFDGNLQTSVNFWWVMLGN